MSMAGNMSPEDGRLVGEDSRHHDAPFNAVIISITIRSAAARPRPISRRRSFQTSASVATTSCTSRRSRRRARKPLEERREGALHPRAVPRTASFRHLVDRRNPLLGREHAEHRVALRLVRVVEEPDRLADVAHPGLQSALALGRDDLRPGGDEERFLRADPGVQRLDRHARVCGDVREPDLLVGTSRELLPGRGEQPLLGRGYRVRPRRHPIGALPGILPSVFD